VWGGRLESIALPQPGSNVAMVKFMTVEGCQKFFDATANGIEVPGSKTLITVEKHQGPNSVNDLLKSCSEGDASRCVRVVDADSDWGNTALRRIAIGTSKIKREIDIIKRGKTAQGVSDEHGSYLDLTLLTPSLAILYRVPLRQRLQRLELHSCSQGR
jgi:hypothetical protein